MYEDYMAIAAPGMKADSGFDRVESFAASAHVPFGVVVVKDGDGVKVKPGNTAPRGISLSTHALIEHPDGGYKATDAVSVMTRGLCWARVTDGGTVTEDGPVSAAADGTVADAGTAIPNAIFRSKAHTVTIAGKTAVIAKVELHNPFAAGGADDA